MYQAVINSQIKESRDQFPFYELKRMTFQEDMMKISIYVFFGICAVINQVLPHGCKFSLKVDKVYSYGLMLQQCPQLITNYSCTSRTTFSRSLKRVSIKHGLVYLCSFILQLMLFWKILGILLKTDKCLFPWSLVESHQVKISTRQNQRRDYIPCYVHKLQNLTISKCLLFGPCAPYEGSVGNEDFSVLMLQKCYLEFLQKQLLLKR